MDKVSQIGSFAGFKFQNVLHFQATRVDSFDESSNVATEDKECAEHTPKKGFILAGDSSVDEVSSSESCMKYFLAFQSKSVLGGKCHNTHLNKASSSKDSSPYPLSDPPNFTQEPEPKREKGELSPEELKLILQLPQTMVKKVHKILPNEEERSNFDKLCLHGPNHLDECTLCRLINQGLGAIPDKEALKVRAPLITVMLRVYKHFCFSRNGVKEYTVSGKQRLGIQYKCR